MIFDYLYSKKDEIEGMHGQSHCWYMGDNLKSSKIFVEINDVNISNDKDCVEMVQFHPYECQKMIQFLMTF